MIEVKITNALKTLCDGRISPLVAEQGTQTPYICYTKVSEVYGDVMCGQSYVTYCFQIDVYSKTLFEAETILKQAYLCLQPLKPFNVRGRHGYESDTGLYRAKLEFFLLN
ncbi:tail completion protein gp17 [Gilliamella apicola]|uniref:tail completion protein gp17 n=1 Tax=Gilliamella apicola TaxID=1196095 RepID=UPI002FEE4FA4